MSGARARKTSLWQPFPRTGAKRVTVASPQTRLAMVRRSAVRTESPHLGRADLERARRIHRVQLRAALAALALLTAVVVGDAGRVADQLRTLAPVEITGGGDGGGAT